MAATDTAPTSQLNIDSARELANRMLEAWNAHDTAALLSLMSEDVVYDDASWPKRMLGHTEVREFLESTWRAIPDLAFEFDDPLVNPEASQIANCWRATATQTGTWDPPGLAPTGRPVKFEGTFVGEFRDGKLRRIRVVYDVAAIMRQLGILPEQRSYGERLIIRLANLRTQLRNR
jgi:steroid delta-isomerase-like uncharacterized protein